MNLGFKSANYSVVGIIMSNLENYIFVLYLGGGESWQRPFAIS